MTDPHAQLRLATKLVAGTYAGPACVEATALLVEVGARLGYELDARPVSLFAYNRVTHESVATGEAGRAFGETFLRARGGVTVGGEFDGGSPFQRHAGHMIVVSNEHALLIDPSFAQFDQLGHVAENYFAEQVHQHRSGRFWHVTAADHFVRYFTADDFPEKDFAAIRRFSQPRADEIVEYLRVNPEQQPEAEA